MNDPKSKNGKWQGPGEVALCRKLAGGDMAAGILLHRIVVIWKLRKKKLERFGQEWLAMPNKDWAVSAGLSDAEFKNRALPRLKKECQAFVEFRTMRLTPASPNILWVNLNTDELSAFVDGHAAMPWDMYELALNGIGILSKPKTYPYKKQKLE